MRAAGSRWAFLPVVAMAVWLSTAAAADRRVALVIGNSAGGAERGSPASRQRE
jgi:hypothetical protein